MLELARDKDESYGAAFLDVKVTALDTDKELYFAEIETGQIIKTHTLVLATGLPGTISDLQEKQDLSVKGSVTAWIVTGLCSETSRQQLSVVEVQP